jgi:hypothetical protein
MKTYYREKITDLFESWRMNSSEPEEIISLLEGLIA